MATERRQMKNAFDGLTEKVEGNQPIKVNSDAFSAWLRKPDTSLSEAVDVLRQINDAQFNIDAYLKPGGKDKVDMWVRDAREACAREGVHPAHPLIAANNVLLASLSRLRPVLFALEQKGADASVINRGREGFSYLAKAVLDGANRDDSEALSDTLETFERLERQFNTDLLGLLHDAGLTKGIETPKAAEQLLFHYRTLSSVLEPARAMQTIVKMGEVTQTETQYPVTMKSEEQKKRINTLKETRLMDPKDGEHPHLSVPLAIQELNALFADKIAADDTMLPAQSRKTQPYGARNAFIVELKNDYPDRTSDSLHYARMAAPVYVGKGAKEDLVREHAQLAMEQIKVAASLQIPALQENELEDLKVHLTCLLTPQNIEHQNKMIRCLEVKADEGAHHVDQFTNVPVNTMGTVFGVRVAGELDIAPEEVPGRIPLAKSDRAEFAAKCLLKAAQTDNVLSVVNCASGQDRTGTVIEQANRVWTKERLNERLLAAQKRVQKSSSAEDKEAANREIAALEVSIRAVDSARAIGANAAEIASHMIPGTPGLKFCSLPETALTKGLFDEETKQSLYRAVADQNKRNKVGDVGFLKSISPAIHQQYEDALRGLQHHSLLGPVAADLRAQIELCRAQTTSPKDVVALTVLAREASFVMKGGDPMMMDTLRYFDNKKGLAFQQLKTVALGFVAAVLFVVGIVTACSIAGGPVGVAMVNMACQLFDGAMHKLEQTKQRVDLHEKVNMFKNKMAGLKDGGTVAEVNKSPLTEATKVEPSAVEPDAPAPSAPAEEFLDTDPTSPNSPSKP